MNTKCLVTKRTRHYYKWGQITWNQPLLNSNGTAGVDRLAVWGAVKNTWSAFHTKSGYSGSYITMYRNEQPLTMTFYMATKNPTIINGFSLYSPTINSDSNWGANKSTSLYGSNTLDNWVLLTSTGKVAQNKQVTYNFTNTNSYHYYKFNLNTYGSGHKDRANVCSFNLIGKEVVYQQGSASDYDYYIDTYDVVLPKVASQMQAFT